MFAAAKAGGGIHILDILPLNTDSSNVDLLRIFVADLVLQILTYVVETECAFIRQRQAEGIATARQRKIRFGC